MVGPDDEGEKADEKDRVDGGPIAPNGAPGVVADHFGDDSHGGEDQHIDFGMAEKPKEVLPEEGAAAACVFEDLAADHEPAGHEETRADDPVEQL